jgi:drug/metabolite transporter (DMT)-like permease
VNDAKVRVGDFANTLDQNRTVQDVSTSILNPIYVAAESIAFPAFHWIAFALMAAGVVSYAFQLVFGKLVVLTKGSINIREIISDSVGLLISGIGLILTTQAATENSTFPESPSGVLSAAAVGVVLGFILYRWNQAEEVDAAHGRQKKRKRTQK